MALPLASPRAAAQALLLSASDVADSAALVRAMPRLAEQVLRVHRVADSAVALDDAFRMQIVAGRWDDAARSLTALRALRSGRGYDTTAQGRATNVQYEMLARARALAASRGLRFDSAFRLTFRETMARLDDPASALVSRAFACMRSAPSVSCTRLGMDDVLRRAAGARTRGDTVSIADAVALIRRFQLEASYAAFAPHSAALVAEDDRRRYVVERDVRVRTPDGATVCALVVRPRAAAARLPALLEFTIYADTVTTMNESRRSASNGYAGVSALTRGKGCSPDAPVPYEHDGADAAAVIAWIARQPWSDGRVGMFGGSYNGFTQWAAAKHRPPALRAMMPSVTVAPGIDVPMEGNVFQTFTYYWPLYAASGKWLNELVFDDRARFWRIQREWYVSGSAYRDMEKIDGTPNPVFARWLEHPTYDAYWQRMIPYGEEFAAIDIPVLTTTGYYDGGQIGALYYLTEHHRRRPNAEHHLVIGPYDHARGQRGTINSLGDELRATNGMVLDSVAQIDLGELRYRWFDHALKGGPKPTILKDRINYQVMGANEWRHAPSIASMGDRRLRFHFTSEKAGGFNRLRSAVEGSSSDAASVPADSVDYVIDLADRSDIDLPFRPQGFVDDTLDTSGYLAFESEPFAEATEVSGLFSGALDLVTNKRDFDIWLALYERTPERKYVMLSAYTARASHVRDRSRRQLLTPGARARLEFTAGRLTSRRFAAGSRLIVLVSTLKHPGAQINYGTGKDVSDETKADAGEPLRVRFYGGSWVEVPARTP